MIFNDAGNRIKKQRVARERERVKLSRERSWMNLATFSQSKKNESPNFVRKVVNHDGEQHQKENGTQNGWGLKRKIRFIEDRTEKRSGVEGNMPLLHG